MSKLRIGVIFGGRSGEHEVSCASARNVLAALDAARYDVEPILIGKDGLWRDGDAARGYLASGIVPVLTADSRRVQDAATLQPVPTDNGRFDVIFPLIHGTNGEDGTLQGLLELAGVAYVGCGVLGSAVGMDKIAQKFLLRDAGIPVAPAVATDAAEIATAWPDVAARAAALGLPVFVKPANAGSSVGISKVKTAEQLRPAVDVALRHDRRVLIEAAVPEARELEVAVLGNDAPRASVIGEIIPSGEFYDYRSKYVDGDSRSVIPADLPEEIAERIHAWALTAFRTLDLAGMARVDFLYSRSNGQIVLNEVNTIPGFTDISMYPMLWRASGLQTPALIDELIRLAQERHATRSALNLGGPTGDWWLEKTAS